MSRSESWYPSHNAEYISGEMNRSFEGLFGTVNCLPGGFTALRYNVLTYRKYDGDATVAEKYYGDLPNYSITDYHRMYLGEDRYLTHLLHHALPKYSLGFCPSARSKTDPPANFAGLVRQRRRWMLGAISNNMYMVTDMVIGNRYPFLNLFKIYQTALQCNFFTQCVLTAFAFRNAFDLSNVLLLSLTAGIPFVLNWISASLTGITLGHWKVIFLQMPMHIICSFVQLFVDFYTLASWSVVSWGGARTQGDNAV